MKVSILVVCVVASLASLVHAQDVVQIRNSEGKACQSTADCVYSDFHRCTGAGCQPFMGTFRAPCNSDEDCQYGLSCRKDEQVSMEDIQAHFENGGTQSQKINSTGIKRCFGNYPPKYPHRLNPDQRKTYDYGYKICDGDQDCPDKSCFLGVCLIQPGAEHAFCKGDDWCRDGNLCAIPSQMDYYNSRRWNAHDVEAAKPAAVEGFCYTPIPAEPPLTSSCTARGLGCWTNKSCCTGYCAWGPFFGLPLQCEPKR